MLVFSENHAISQLNLSGGFVEIAEVVNTTEHIHAALDGF